MVLPLLLNLMKWWLLNNALNKLTTVREKLEARANDGYVQGVHMRVSLQN